jgi:hypothetical protein
VSPRGRAGRIVFAGALVSTCLATAACAMGSAPTSTGTFLEGNYRGSDSAGVLTWTLHESGQTVSGTGEFLSSGSQAAASYTLRGTFVSGLLAVRLVGAPGDTNADSVWFTGRADPDLYQGEWFNGQLYGSNPALFGQLEMTWSGSAH